MSLRLSSVVTASLTVPIVSSVTGSLASSLAPVGVMSSFTPVGVTSVLSVRESRSLAELERMHTGLGALLYAAEFDKRPDTEEAFSSSGGTASSSMSVALRWVEQQRERSPPVRSAFSATGSPTVAYDRSVSSNSLRCDEEVACISAAAASPSRPRTSPAPDSPSRCYLNMPVGEPQRRSPQPASCSLSHVVACTVTCTVTDVRPRCGRLT